MISEATSTALLDWGAGVAARHAPLGTRTAVFGGGGEMLGGLDASDWQKQEKHGEREREREMKERGGETGRGGVYL